MLALQRYRYFVAESTQNALIVHFTSVKLWHEEEVRAVRAQLEQVLERHGNLVLNLENMQSLSSSLIGVLVLLNRKTRASKGQLLLCHLSPRVAEQLATLHLTGLLTICASQQEALRRLDDGSGCLSAHQGGMVELGPGGAVASPQATYL